ncbi:hypothetical protein JKF63_07707 [Porcisia hertigi]|uniref:Uncharacterized protein n=1 Tax=Porcisia hertigi TaxID=2761500 RepID=A0A836LLP8_9TRYP|nr:hypothetical protein JKF63_07707 [Porcisia hertigi]
MKALRMNNSDEWDGKPQQETFQVYEAVPPVDATRTATSSAADLVGTPRWPLLQDTGNNENGSDSLDGLMANYVRAVRDLRAFDERVAADGVSASTTVELNDATLDMAAKKHNATTPSKVAADDGSSFVREASHAGAAAPVDMAELLAALDRLPPITIKDKGQ